MEALTREAFLNLPALRTELVDVPELGGCVKVSEMTAKSRDAFESWVLKNRDASGNCVGMRAQLIALTVVNEDGTTMFRGADIAALNEMPASAADRICDVARRLNGMGVDVEQVIEGN